MSKINLIKKKAYYYAVTTCGGFASNAISQLAQLLHGQNITLHYGAKLVMFSNYIVLYKMRQEHDRGEHAGKPYHLSLVNPLDVII